MEGLGHRRAAIESFQYLGGRLGDFLSQLANGRLGCKALKFGPEDICKFR